MILDLGRALAQVGPFLGLLGEAVLVCAFRAPDDSCGGASGIETSVRAVTFVSIAELSVNLRVGLYIIPVSAKTRGRKATVRNAINRTGEQRHNAGYDILQRRKGNNLYIPLELGS